MDLAFIKKDITQEEAARRLGVSPAYYSVHINRDIQRAIRENVTPAVAEATAGTLQQIEEVRGIFDKLITRAKDLLDLPMEEMPEGRIRAIASEVRQYAEFFSRLSGQLHDSPLIQINQLNIKYVKLVEVVNEILCPVCKAKLMERLGEKEIEIIAS